MTILLLIIIAIMIFQIIINYKAQKRMEFLEKMLHFYKGKYEESRK
jgi:hypothetical protein